MKECFIDLMKHSAVCYHWQLIAKFCSLKDRDYLHSKQANFENTVDFWKQTRLHTSIFMSFFLKDVSSNHQNPCIRSLRLSFQFSECDWRLSDPQKNSHHTEFLLLERSSKTIQAVGSAGGAVVRAPCTGLSPYRSGPASNPAPRPFAAYHPLPHFLSYQR